MGFVSPAHCGFAACAEVARAQTTSKLRMEASALQQTQCRFHDVTAGPTSWLHARYGSTRRGYTHATCDNAMTARWDSPLRSGDYLLRDASVDAASIRTTPLGSASAATRPGVT